MRVFYMLARFGEIAFRCESFMIDFGVAFVFFENSLMMDFGAPPGMREIHV